MVMVMTITRRWTVLGKLKHYLFECPTFWRRKPAFHCPCCGTTYRCYWDGNDVGGKINVCHKCADEYERIGAWNETPNVEVTCVPGFSGTSELTAGLEPGAGKGE